jgi:PAS domain S-box-containing protein
MKKNPNGAPRKQTVIRKLSSNGENGLLKAVIKPSIQLEETAARFRELYDFAPNGYVSFDRSGRIAEANVAVATLVGLPRDRLVGMPFAVFVWREDTGMFLHHLLRCRASDSRIETELRLKNLRREIIFARLISTPVIKSPLDGGVVFHTAIVDLTASKLAQEALRAKEAELELIVTRTPFMLTRCTRDLRYQFVSPSYADMLGRKQEDIAGKLIANVIGQKALAAIRPYVDRVLSGENVSYEAMIPYKDAGAHFLSTTYLPEKNERGEVIGWIASMTDIGERKKADERFRMAVEASPSGMIMVDRDRKITLINSRAERLFGYKREELLEQSVEMLVPERFRGQVGMLAEPRTTSASRELSGLRRDGTEVPIEIRLNPIRIGGHRFVLISVVDTTERRKAQEKIAGNMRALMVLHELAEFCSRPQSKMQTSLQKILKAAITIGNADKGNLQIFNQNSGALEIAVHSGFAKPFLKFFKEVKSDDASACAAVMREAKYTIVDDITRSEIFAGQRSRRVLLAAGVRAVHSIPLKSTAGNLVGILSIHFSRPHTPRQRDLGFMDLLARQAADYIERKQAESALAEVARQQAALYQLAQRWQNAKSLDDVYAAGLDAITSALNCDRASILLYDDQQVMRFVAWRGLSAAYRKAVEGHSPWKPNSKNPKPQSIADARLADLPEPLKKKLRREGIRAAAFIPLVMENKLSGKFMMYYRVPHVFTDTELDLAMTIARQLAQAIQHERDEESLRESEERMRATVEQATAGVARCDTNGRFIFVNRKLCQMLGYTELELVGKTIADVTHRDDVDENMRLFHRMINNGKPFETEKRYIRKDGSVLWADVSASAVRGAGSKIQSTVAVVVDVTARRSAEAELQRSNEVLEQRVRDRTREIGITNRQLQSEIERRKGLEGEILAVSDREQQRLGQELHDGLCQHLTAVAFMTRSMAMRLREHRVIDADDIDKIAELVNNAAVDTRNLSRALHRLDVDAANLTIALQDLVDREIWTTPCLLDVKPSFYINDDGTAAHLYRIAREAIINANKHAQARKVVVRLERVRQDMVLRVIDDGIGFPKELKPQQGLGYHIMKYRTQLMGGRLEIDSPQTGGTRLSCYVPVHPPQSRTTQNGDKPAMPKLSRRPVADDRTLRHLMRHRAANR